jgi:hypothetical protein
MIQADKYFIYPAARGVAPSHNAWPAGFWLKLVQHTFTIDLF